MTESDNQPSAWKACQSALVRIAAHRSRLLIAIVIGVASGFLFPSDWRASMRWLAAWDTAVYAFLGMLWLLIIRTDVDTMRRHFEEEDETAAAALVLVCCAAVASIVAIVLVTSGSEATDSARWGKYLLTAATVAGGWTLVPTIFTLHYADLYYSVSEAERPLEFPGAKADPNYWDFVYYSFTIAVASQTADVATRTTPMRRATIAQSLLAFFFNASILGFVINVVAGTVGK